MKIILTLCFFIFVSCSGMKKENTDYSNMNNDSKINLVKEMDTNKEIESFAFKKITNEQTNIFFEEFKNYESAIKKVNLLDVSKWAQDKMINYKLPDNFIDETSAKEIYQTADKTVIVYKSILLPTHSPLVKRFLYFITVYNAENKIKKIYITIQGYAEE